MSGGLSRYRGIASNGAVRLERPADLVHPAARVDDFRFEHKLGQGTFGIVYKGVCKSRNKLVAIKHVLCRIQDETLSITTLREISTLKLLKHDNIIELVDVISDTRNKFLDSHIHNQQMYKLDNVLCMVFPYMSYDLTGILQNLSISLTEADRKSIMYQLFQGINFIHQNSFLHRDIKASNILINNNGILKIGDFGLVRRYMGPLPELDREGGCAQRLTEVVMTRWYRAPEVLFGNRKYGTGVDIWGIGCVFGELYEKVPILKGETDIDQGIKIFKLCGAPSNNVPFFDRWKTNNSVHPSSIAKNGDLVERFRSKMSPDAINLLKGLLIVDHKYRFTTAKALEHDWFHTEPRTPARINTNFPECHEADAIRKNQLEKAKSKTQPNTALVSNEGNYSQGKSVPHSQVQVQVPNGSLPHVPSFQGKSPGLNNYPAPPHPQQYPGQPYPTPVPSKNYAAPMMYQSQSTGSNSFQKRNDYQSKNQRYYNYDQNQRGQYPNYEQSNPKNNYGSRNDNYYSNYNQKINRPNRNFIPEKDQQNGSNPRNSFGNPNSPRYPPRSGQSIPPQIDHTPTKSHYPAATSNNDARVNFRSSKTYEDFRADTASGDRREREHQNGANYYGYKQRTARSRDSERETIEPSSKKPKVDY